MVTTRRSTKSSGHSARTNNVSIDQTPSSPIPRTPSNQETRTVNPRESVASASILSADSQTSKRGLPHHVLLSLVIDIDKQGGIKEFRKSGQNVRKLCDKNEDVYGRKGDPRRRQIGNKVNKWCKLSDQEFESRVLVKYGVIGRASEQKAIVKRLQESFGSVSSEEEEQEDCKEKNDVESSHGKDEIVFSEPEQTPHLPKKTASNKKKKGIPHVIETESVSSDELPILPAMSASKPRKFVGSI